jgi:hypothetical protein
MIKNVALILLSLGFNLVFADNENDVYVLFFYDVKSIGKHLTDAECQKYYSEPLRYTIENDKPKYFPHAYLNIKNYQRMTNFKVNDKHRMYSGVLSFNYPNQQSETLKEHVSFKHMRHHQMIEGSFYVEDYCKGHMVGVDEYKHRR